MDNKTGRLSSALPRKSTPRGFTDKPGRDSSAWSVRHDPPLLKRPLLLPARPRPGFLRLSNQAQAQAEQQQAHGRVQRAPGWARQPGGQAQGGKAGALNHSRLASAAPPTKAGCSEELLRAHAAEQQHGVQVDMQVQQGEAAA
ncbi:MAG: hypothetical protein U1E77_03815 [Inhella sp.]